MTDQEEKLFREIEDLKMLIRAMENDLKELTKQNYMLIERISQLCDELRLRGISLNDLAKI
jgi:hypothetical protein